jgi:hypothetical protein
VGSCGLDSLAQCGNQWQEVVNIIMKYRFPRKVRDLLRAERMIFFEEGPFSTEVVIVV